MAVTYVDGDNSTSLNVTDITGLAWPVHAAEDLALFLGAIVDTATATIDANFTTERSDIDGSLESILARRLPGVMTGSESGDITMSTGATTNRMSAAVALYRGAAAIATIAYQNETGAATTSHVSPTITIASSSSALVLLYAERVTNSATPITPPTGFTKRIEWATGGSGGTAVMICDKLTGNTAGSFTPDNVTATTASGSVGIYLVELSAASSGTTVSPTGIASEEAFGTVTVTATLAVSPTGIASAEAFGTPAIAATLTVSPSGVDSAETVGSPIIAASLTVQPDGIASTEAFGVVTIQTGGTVSPDGVPTAEAFGVPTVSATLTVTPDGITSAEAFGTPTITATLTVSPTGIASAEVFGTLTISTVPLRDVTVIARIRTNHVTGGVRLTDLVTAVRASHITGGIDVSRTLRTGSVEYVVAEVTFVGETAASIATATGQVQITTTDTTPTAGDPNWVNPDVTTRTDVTGGAKLSLSKLHTAGTAATYRLWAKVTDNPEVPILLCGSFDVRS